MYAAISPVAGTQPFNDWFTPDTTQRHPLGIVVDAVDQYWGLGRFMYCKAPADATIIKGSVVIWNMTYVLTLTPNTANQGFPVAVATNSFPSGTFGWVQLAGKAVYKISSTAITADAPAGLVAAGVLGTGVAGKTIIGLRHLLVPATTVVVTAIQTIGSPVLTVTTPVSGFAGYDGFFLGMALTGSAGIPASTVVAKLDPDGRTIYTGSAIGTVGDKNSTGAGAITLTGTYTGYSGGLINTPSCTLVTA